jgi:hypothetical protein
MLHPSPDLQFAPVGCLICFTQGAIPIGAFIGEVLRLGHQFLEPLALRLAPVGAVSIESGFVPEQEIRRFMAVMDVGRRYAGMDAPIQSGCPCRCAASSRSAIDSLSGFQITAFLPILG